MMTITMNCNTTMSMMIVAVILISIIFVPSGSGVLHIRLLIPRYNFLRLLVVSIRVFVRVSVLSLDCSLITNSEWQLERRWEKNQIMMKLMNPKLNLARNCFLIIVGYDVREP